jgi:hypothetical protein
LDFNKKKKYINNSSLLSGIVAIMGAFLPINIGKLIMNATNYSITLNPLLGRINIQSSHDQPFLQNRASMIYTSFIPPVLYFIAILILITAFSIFLIGIYNLIKKTYLSFSIYKIFLGILLILFPIIEFFLVKNSVFKSIGEFENSEFIKNLIFSELTGERLYLGFMGVSISSLPYFGFYMIVLPSFIIIFLSIYSNTLKKKERKKDRIKKIIMNLKKEDSRIAISEIAEKCGEKEKQVITNIKEMIKRKIITARYFKTTRMVAFMKQTEMAEIDKLIESFDQWEKEGVARKKE